jgi:hypothetical protein
MKEEEKKSSRKPAINERELNDNPPVAHKNIVITSSQN